MGFPSFLLVSRLLLKDEEWRLVDLARKKKAERKAQDPMNVRNLKSSFSATEGVRAS
jgi:hypothetical protein